MKSDVFSIFFRGGMSRELPGASGSSGSPSAVSSDDGKGGSYAERTQYVYGQDSACTISAYYHALELRAKTMSQLVWQYQRLNREGGNFVVDNYGRNGVLNYIISVRWNPIMTATEAYKQLELDVLQKGNGYVYIERDGDGNLVHLWLCNTGSYNVATDSYCLTYRYPGGYMSLPNVPSGDVLHVRNVFTVDGITGISTLRYMCETLTLERTNRALETETAAKGGRMKIIVNEKESGTAGVLSRHSQNEMQKSVNRIGNDMYSKDAIYVPNAASIQPISQSLTDMEILSSRSFTIAEVARFMSVPKILLGDGSNASYKSPEAAMNEFYLFAIAPSIAALEDELNSKLLGAEDFGKRRFHVCEKNLRRLDPTGQADVNRKLLEIGVMTINELRKEYDMPAIEKGDIPYITAQVAELGSSKLRDISGTQIAMESQKDGDNDNEEEGGAS